MSLIDLNKKKANKLHQQAEAMSDKGQKDKALELYLKAIKLDPDKAETYYNIGLIYKYRNEWELSLHYNQRANQLTPTDEAAKWNVAIAATALRKWDVARGAWHQVGINLDGGSGPIHMNFGRAPVRLNPDNQGEVVWGTRIDPVRVRIDNIPFLDSGFRYHDIVLHDGAADGYRKFEKREYPVFNVLELFEASVYQTFVAEVDIHRESDLDKLWDIFSESPHDFEDWTMNTRLLCKKCSEGIAHKYHDTDNASEWSSKRILGVAVFENQKVITLFEEWSKLTGAKLMSLNEGLQTQ